MTKNDVQKIITESLRDWFKKEKWVRITTSGNIAGPCGTSKNKKNPDRCLPKAKAQSLSKAERAATARKKKKAGAKGKTVVKNTKAATVKGTYESKKVNEYGKRAHDEFTTKISKQILDLFKQHGILKKEPYQRKYKSGLSDKDYVDSRKKQTLGMIFKTVERIVMADTTVTKEDIRNFVVGTLHEMQNEGTIEEKDDRCTRLAKQKYDTWPSAYASGAVVRCRRGEIWKDVKEEVIQESDCKHGRYYCNHDKKYKCRKGPKKSR